MAKNIVTKAIGSIFILSVFSLLFFTNTASAYSVGFGYNQNYGHGSLAGHYLYPYSNNTVSFGNPYFEFDGYDTPTTIVDPRTVGYGYGWGGYNNYGWNNSGWGGYNSYGWGNYGGYDRSGIVLYYLNNSLFNY